VDVFAAWRHAIALLARHGFDRISLINIAGPRSHAEARDHIARHFAEICAACARPVHGEVIWLPDAIPERRPTIQRLAQRLRPRHGVLTNAPVSPGLVMMALMHCDLRIPDDVEVVALNCTPSQAVTCPPIAHYPFPREAFCRAIRRAAVHYFEQGKLPPLHTVLQLDLVPDLAPIFRTHGAKCGHGIYATSFSS
jgi:DNA-binding LacI/PurR family transcriptional regulator